MTTVKPRTERVETMAKYRDLYIIEFAVKSIVFAVLLGLGCLVELLWN